MQAKRIKFAVGLSFALVAFAVGLSFALMVGPQEESQKSQTELPHWGYGVDDGPSVWAQLDSAYAPCATGKRQSPIDILGAKQVEAPAVAFAYQPMSLQIHHNGHTVEVASTSDNWIDVAGKRYQLVQFHFHTPSEHTVQGEAFDMEIHLVHRNDAGELAVVGILVRRGDEHPNLDALAKLLPKPNESRAVTDVQIAPSELLPDTRRMYRYEGSLTTPPCSEDVRWHVLETPIEMSDAGLANFEAVLGANNRPVQPLHGREPNVDRHEPLTPP